MFAGWAAAQGEGAAQALDRARRAFADAASVLEIAGRLPVRVIAPSPYRAPRWLAGGHAQTIWPYFLRRPHVPMRRERVDTPDGDFWLFDWLDAPASNPDAPLVVLFHGLEGSAASHYARALFARLAALGWRGVVPHFRGCADEPNRLPRAYHSGDHEEIAAMLAAVRARAPAAAVLHAVGVSLGGSALLNWLGRAGAGAREHGVARRGRVRPDRPDGGRAGDRPRLQPPLRESLPAHAEAEGPVDGATLSGPHRRQCRRPRALDVGVRRCRHLADCTVSRTPPTTGRAPPASRGSRRSASPRWC